MCDDMGDVLDDAMDYVKGKSELTIFIRYKQSSLRKVTRFLYDTPQGVETTAGLISRLDICQVEVDK